MRFIAALWRLAIALLCFVGTYSAWLVPNQWVYFTYQSGFVLGLVMLWSGMASLIKGVQPPAWLKGCLLSYAIITALVAFFLMPPADPHYSTHVLGVMTNTMLHRIGPIMTVIDFILFEAHRRFTWHYIFSWLGYFPVYLALVLIRAQFWPHSGPELGGNPYPYTFIDLKSLGWMQFGISVFKLALAFVIINLVIFLLDKILPAKPLLSSRR